MPGLARKILVFAAVDGLILQPLLSKKDQRGPAPVRILYGDATISQTPQDASSDQPKPEASFEAYGIVGLITVSRFSYLVSITRRHQVATVRGCPVYVVTEVALTPCTSQSDANEAIARTAAHLDRKPAAPSAPAEAGDDTENSANGDGDGTDAEAASIMSVPADDDATDDMSITGDASKSDSATGKSSGGDSEKSSIAQDVISRKGSYGRFAQRWFSRSGWMQDQKRISLSSKALEQAAIADELEDAKKAMGPSENVQKAAQEVVAKKIDANEEESSAAVNLLPKLLRTTQILFGSSRSFYFSYDYDITRSLANQPKARLLSDVPLHKLVDPLYFWNRHALQPFVDAGVDALALPLMQGFVGQRSFVVDSHPPQMDDDAAAKESLELSDFSQKQQGWSSAPASPPSGPEGGASAELRPSEKTFDITVISRRSTKRAGLRYLRRGVDEDGNVANCVESEQILSPSDPDGSSKVYSFVQVRGSIPLFFTQTPYSLKPLPVIQHSPEANYIAMKKHFDTLRQQYGSVQIVNLVEKHGTEATIGTRYEQTVQKMNEENGPDQAAPFEWFDFHDMCRGMKFENVSFLLDILGKKLDSMGSTVEEVEADGVAAAIVAEQKGVLRTNCMDCLDRTNVCQSSFAKHMLDMQLKEQGFDMALQRDQENAWFNTLWADNGDAISKQYASTGAMKGDYTRTRKRNYRGALTDVGLSLTRFYNGMVNDFFLQTTIDFLLGNVTYRIFDEFEVNMMTKDPAVSMQKMREQAIELSQRRVVADDSEEFVGGWTMLTPRVPDSLTAQPFDEAVLLLTDTALYLCRFDWNLDKVSSFERVALAHIQRIRFGTYITSTMAPTQTDEMKNVGFVVYYKPGSDDELRINTRSLSSLTPGVGKGSGGDGGKSKPPAVLASLLGGGRRPANPPGEKRIALKALYSQSALLNGPSAGKGAGEGAGRLTEMQQVVTICADIERMVMQSKPIFSTGPQGEGKHTKSILEEGDVISLAEAKKSTGLLEQLGHSIKKLVWA